MGAYVTSCLETNRVLNIGACFPAERDGAIAEVPTRPCEAKKRLTAIGEQNMVVAALIVHYGLVMIFLDITRKISNFVQRKREVFDPKI